LIKDPGYSPAISNPPHLCYPLPTVVAFFFFFPITPRVCTPHLPPLLSTRLLALPSLLVSSAYPNLSPLRRAPRYQFVSHPGSLFVPFFVSFLFVVWFWGVWSLHTILTTFFFGWATCLFGLLSYFPPSFPFLSFYLKVFYHHLIVALTFPPLSFAPLFPCYHRLCATYHLSSSVSVLSTPTRGFPTCFFPPLLLVFRNPSFVPDPFILIPRIRWAPLSCSRMRWQVFYHRLFP